MRAASRTFASGLTDWNRLAIAAAFDALRASSLNTSNVFATSRLSFTSRSFCCSVFAAVMKPRHSVRKAASATEPAGGFGSPLAGLPAGGSASPVVTGGVEGAGSGAGGVVVEDGLEELPQAAANNRDATTSDFMVHQTEQDLAGFIGVPGAHAQASENSFMLRRDP